MDSKYLIVGSSHAALEAAAAIRMIDSRGPLTLLTRDGHLPYSPTILPYGYRAARSLTVFSSATRLYFCANSIDFVPGADVASARSDAVNGAPRVRRKLGIRAAFDRRWSHTQSSVRGAASKMCAFTCSVRSMMLLGLRQAMHCAKSALVVLALG